MRRLIALLSALWLGMHIGFGYLVAPLLFTRLQTLPDGKMLAGNLAGVLFHWVNGLGFITWLCVFWLLRRDNQHAYHRNKLPIWALTLTVLIAINEWLITPVIEALKNGQHNWLYDLTGGGFGLWHGISSIIYLIVSLIGLGLCVRLLRFASPT